MNITNEHFNSLILPVDVNLKQLRYLFKASKLNRKYYIQNKLSEYINAVPDTELENCLKTDIKYFNYKGKISGFRFERAPLFLHKKYLSKPNMFPPITLATIINNNLIRIVASKEYQELCSEFGKDVNKSLSSISHFENCAIEKYDKLKIKYASIDLAFYLTLAGVIITDNPDDLNDLNEKDKLAVLLRPIEISRFDRLKRYHPKLAGHNNPTLLSRI